MRLRNIPGADAAITESVYCIKSPETHKGHWQEIFPSQQPLHIVLITTQPICRIMCPARINRLLRMITAIDNT